MFVLVGAPQAGPSDANARARAPASTQEPPGENSSATPEPVEPVAVDSPRASVLRFLKLGEQGRWAEASAYLDVPRGDPRANELAERLHDVITQTVAVHPGELSPLAEGDPDDGLAEGVDELATVIDGEGRPVQLRLRRYKEKDAEGAARWVFSRKTLAHVDDLYAAIEEGHWVTRHVPSALRERGPKGVRYWQWLALPLAAILGILFGRLLAHGTVRLASRALRARGWAARLVARLKRPMRVGWALVAFWICVSYIDLPARVYELIEGIVGAMGYVTALWGALHATAILGDEVVASAWAQDRPTLTSFSQVGVKFVKVLIIAFALLAALARLGFPVASVMAGLGLGGIAIALAAQKTVENLFGTISILADQPFRVGDVIRVGALQGSVESIGLRSTRIRRVDGVLVVFPNGALADTHLESLSDRATVRMSTRLPVARTATAGDLRALRAALRDTLLRHPKVLDRDLSIDVCSIEQSWFDLEIAALIDTQSIVEFERVRGELIEACIATATSIHVALALPARATLSDPKPSLA